MKTITLILAAILILGAPTVLAEDETKEIPVEDAMKAYCQTRVNNDYAGTDWSVVRIPNPDGTEIGLSKEGADPNFPKYRRHFTITEPWTDHEGNILFKLPGKPIGGLSHLSEMVKIGNSGTVLETVYSYADPPDEIDPGSDRYRIWYRK
jgi:hypothetical protein